MIGDYDDGRNTVVEIILLVSSSFSVVSWIYKKLDGCIMMVYDVLYGIVDIEKKLDIITNTMDRQ